MADVVDLAGRSSSRAASPHQDIIVMLEQLLEKARAGSVQHCCVAWLGPHMIPMDAYVGTGHPQEVVTLIGSIELLKHTVLDQIKGQ